SDVGLQFLYGCIAIIGSKRHRLQNNVDQRVWHGAIGLLPCGSVSEKRGNVSMKFVSQLLAVRRTFREIFRLGARKSYRRFEREQRIEDRTKRINVAAFARARRIATTLFRRLLPRRAHDGSPWGLNDFGGRFLGFR